MRQERVKELLRHLAAEFVSSAANTTPLITVTDVRVPPNFSEATVLVTVYPDRDEEAALLFLKRKRGELRTFVKARTKLKTIPRFDFTIDEGEKKRQRIDELLW